MKFPALVSPGLPLLGACLLAAGLGGCRAREITVYDVPKEAAAAPADAGAPAPAGAAASPALPAMPRPAAAPAAATTARALAWTAPAEWAVKPAGAMRRGSYGIPTAQGEADVSVTAFPGDVGGVLPNVNRWRGQVGLPPVEESALAQITSTREINTLHCILLDATGTAGGAGSRIVAAMIPHGGMIWFFKLTAPDAVVAAVKPAFLQFLETIHEP